MQLKKLAIVVGVVALTAGGGSAAAGGGGHGGWKKVHVQFTPSDPVQSPGEFACDTGTSLVDQQCMSVGTTTATQAGDLVGSTVQGEARALSTGVAFAPTAVAGTFAGTVTGCGKGRFLYIGNGVRSDTSSDFTYTIVAGTGFGDLAGITGSFEAHDAPGAPSVITGVVRCLQHH